MSTITSLSVSSSGVIKLRWEGVGEKLIRPDGNDLQNSRVTGPGAKAVNGGPGPLTLTGWTSSDLIEHVAGNSPTFEVILTPPLQPSIMFQPGLIVMITFSLPTSNGARASHPFSASATVDAPYGPVVNAIAGPGGVKQDLDLLTGFPLQIYDGSGTPSGGGGGGGWGGASAAPTARAMIDAQMKAVLGRSTGTGGVTGTLAALDRSFQPVVSGGVDTWVWQPQSYAVQSDIGAGVTGEQASLARLAASIGDEILPLISGLTPLVPESSVNPDEIAAAQSIIAASWPALVTELGTDGGPRIVRAQSFLEDAATQLVTLGILLGMYASGTTLGSPALGLPPRGLPLGAFDPLNTATWPVPTRTAGVVTNDDEETYTNYVIAYDRVQVVIGRFVPLYVGAPGTPPIIPAQEPRGFLVTQLQRALDAAGEAADAVFTALDSVNLGNDEREVIYLGPNGSLSVEDIISWADDFPAQEATSLLQGGGNVGVASIASRAGDIQTAVQQLQAFALNAPQTGLSHPRVTYALQILSNSLSDVITYASDPGLQYTPPTAQ